jgi:hypothetical protein
MKKRASDSAQPPVTRHAWSFADNVCQQKIKKPDRLRKGGLSGSFSTFLFKKRKGGGRC